MSGPIVTVCAGGGGVGKTTTSAALALALARGGARTLVVTVDPARRLADAMGVPIGTIASRVDLEGTGGRLLALMPDPRSAVRTFVEHLFAEEPDARARVLANGIFVALEDALAGVHELISVMLVARTAQGTPLDHVIVDTAPSRYALDVVAYPGRLAALLESRALGWFGALGGKAGAPEKGEGGALAWGRRRVEGAIASVVGPRLLGDLSSLTADLALVRHRFAAIAREAEGLLLGPETRFVLVAGGSGASLGDLQHLATKLARLERRPIAAILNRALLPVPAWVGPLRDVRVSAALRGAMRDLETERAARAETVERAALVIARAHPRLAQVRLPDVALVDPGAIVEVLAGHMRPLVARGGLLG